MKFAYSDAEDPLLPYLPVVIVSRKTGEKTPPLQALFDTGAQISMIPEKQLIEIDANRGRFVALEGLWREARTVRLYHVKVEIAGRLLEHVDVVGGPHDETILGRDVLNQLRVLLDRPALTTELLD